MRNRLSRFVIPRRVSRKLTDLYISFKQKAMRPEFFFLLFAAPVGLILVFLTPPLQSPDEQSHFYQSYAVSDLNFIPDKHVVDEKVIYGAELPTSIFDAAGVFMGVIGKPEARFDTDIYRDYVTQDLDVHTTSSQASGTVNTPFVYIPQSTGIAIGKTFNASPLVLIWLGRIMNLAVWLALLFFTIRMFPVAKWALGVLALNPVSVFISATLSPDVINVGLAFLFTSLVMAAALSKEVLTKKQLIIIGLVLIALALTKSVNVLFIGLLFVIPWKNYGSIKKLLLYSLTVALVAVSVAVAWNSATSEAIQASVEVQRPGVGVDTSRQVGTILQNPFNYAKILIQNYVIVQPGYYGDAVLHTFFAGFGWLDTSIPFWTVGLYVLVLFFAALYQMGRGGSLGRYQRIVFALLFMALCGAAITAMYVLYTPVGAKIVDGVQGRYFIPASILLLGLFTARKKVLQISEKTLIMILASSLTIILATLLLRVFLRYYM